MSAAGRHILRLDLRKEVELQVGRADSQRAWRRLPASLFRAPEDESVCRSRVLMVVRRMKSAIELKGRSARARRIEAMLAARSPAMARRPMRKEDSLFDGGAVVGAQDADRTDDHAVAAGVLDEG